MTIQIAERLRPFCHVPGTFFVLPGLGHLVQIFPTLIRLFQFHAGKPLLIEEMPLAFQGPIHPFTVCTDLEKGELLVSGKTAQGWMSYRLRAVTSAQPTQVALYINRLPKGELDIPSAFSYSFSVPVFVPAGFERLSLGNHKGQDWELVKRRLNLQEILPIWHRLGQWLPPLPKPSLNEGMFALLEACQQGKPEEITSHFSTLFQAGFTGLLAPRLEDTDYQGLVPPSSKVLTENPLLLLTEGSRLIRHLFVQQQAQEVFILPRLPPEFAQGRLLDVNLEEKGTLNLEWTKKTIRRLECTMKQEGEWLFHFRCNVRSYRLRRSLADKGKEMKCNTPLFLEKNCYYLFDNFK